MRYINLHLHLHYITFVFHYSVIALVTPPRDKSLIAKLRVPRKYPALASRTKKYQSFINFALLHYQ